MDHNYKLGLIVLACLLFCLSAKAQQNPKPAPQVMLLGTYHFANPGLDAANMEIDDVKAPKRQEEIAQLAQMLLAFKPTKIVLEGSKQSDYYHKRFDAYRQHGMTDSLSRNESEQIGLRLAHLAGHEQVYPIDYQMEFFPPSMDSLFAKHPVKAAYLENKITSIQALLNQFTEEVLSKKPIYESLYLFNTDSLISFNHALYLDFLKELTAGDNHAGADLVANWYHRNLIIFQNLVQVTNFEAAEERILIIYGQGHVKYLRDLLRESDYYEYVEVNDYLQQP